MAKICTGFKDQERLNDIMKGTRDALRSCKTVNKVNSICLERNWKKLSFKEDLRVDVFGV